MTRLPGRPQALQGVCRRAYDVRMRFSSRAAVAADIPVLTDLMAAFYAESGYKLDRDWAQASFLALLRNKAHGETQLFSMNGDLVGYGVITLRFSMEVGGLDACIDDLFVHHTHRRRGVARRGVEALLAECRKRGVLMVRVEVGRNDETAKALYNQFGLRPYDDGREVLVRTLDPAA